MLVLCCDRGWDVLEVMGMWYEKLGWMLVMTGGDDANTPAEPVGLQLSGYRIERGVRMQFLGERGCYEKKIGRPVSCERIF